MKAAGLRWSAQLDALRAACLRVTMLVAIAEFERELIQEPFERRRARAKVSALGSGRTTRWGLWMAKQRTLGRRSRRHCHCSATTLIESCSSFHVSGARRYSSPYRRPPSFPRRPVRAGAW
jgi:DNA invertase Pin-like site-specific DNA recombinase